jgi:hypothetical protein
MHIQHTVSGSQIRCVLQNFNSWHQLQQNLNVRAAISFTSRQGMGSHCYSCRWRLAYGVFLVDCLKLILIFLPIIFLQTLTRDVIFLRGGESKITLDTTYLSDPMSYWYLPWWKKILTIFWQTFSSYIFELRLYILLLLEQNEWSARTNENNCQNKFINYMSSRTTNMVSEEIRTRVRTCYYYR